MNTHTYMMAVTSDGRRMTLIGKRMIKCAMNFSGFLN